MTPKPPPVPSRRAALALLAGFVLLGGCTVRGTSPGSQQKTRLHEQLIKTDVDHFVEASQRRLFVSLRRLAEKLYRRNPREWRKSADSFDDALAAIFAFDHGWRFDELDQRRDIAALMLAFELTFEGDRVKAFIIGLASMVQTAFGNRVGFYVVNELEPQAFYNAARNVEIAAWKLATAREPGGAPLLLSNEMGEIANLSFEREIGRILAILETLTDVIEIKTERNVVRFVQNLATAVFLPIP